MSKFVINDIIDEIANEYPSISVTLNKMQFKPTHEIGTLACDFCGNGVYNPDYMNQLTHIKSKAVLIHECLHIYYNHFSRFLTHENTTYKNMQSIEDVASKIKAWNIAADAFINEQIIEELPNDSLPDDCITFYSIHKLTWLSIKDIKNSCTEDIYEAILQSTSMNTNRSFMQSADTNNDYGNINNPEDYSQQNDYMLDKNVQEVIDKTYNDKKHIVSIEKNQKRNENSDNPLKNNAIDWKSLIEDFTYKISGKINSNRTWRRPSKRYRNIYPISKGRLNKSASRSIIFGIDTSGSMNTEKITNVMSVIKSYAGINNIQFKYFFWSTEVSETYNYESYNKFVQDLNNADSGGTSLTCALEKEQLSNDGLIIISDMMFDESGMRLEKLLANNNSQLAFISIAEIGLDTYKLITDNNYKIAVYY